MSAPIKYRSLFLSDFHLGSKHCQAERLWYFLLEHGAEKVYLIGDIIEVNIMSCWPPFHNEVMGELFNMGARGTEIIYVPGNHDAIFRAHTGHYGNLKIERHAYHANQRGTFLVIHGDEQDRFRSHLLLQVLTWIERKTGGNYWELLRSNFGRIIYNHSIAFEGRMITLAREYGYAGIVCGHIHSPKIVEGNVLYLNPGDWIRHCTAIVEHYTGQFEIISG